MRLCITTGVCMICYVYYKVRHKIHNGWYQELRSLLTLAGINHIPPTSDSY